MNAINIAPMQWADIEDIDDIEPVNDNDHDCLYEIRKVLRKHGKQDRFGVALLHSHLNISDNEAFLEQCDEQNRVLEIRPVPCEEAAKDGNVGTIFRLIDGDFVTMDWCRSYCDKGFLGDHSKAHNRVPGD